MRSSSMLYITAKYGDSSAEGNLTCGLEAVCLARYTSASTSIDGSGSEGEKNAADRGGRGKADRTGRRYLDEDPGREGACRESASALIVTVAMDPPRAHLSLAVVADTSTQTPTDL